MGSIFGERLKSIRSERQMSQDELANLLGTSKQVISRYENGQRSPKITVVSDYAAALGIPLEYFLDSNFKICLNSNKPATVTDGELERILQDPIMREINEILLSLDPPALAAALDMIRHIADLSKSRE